MKLTIIRLHDFAVQDRLDLAKIWPLSERDETLSEPPQIWVAKFNGRLLAAVKVTLAGNRGELADLCVREVTRRRGVGGYLLAELRAHNPTITHWWMADQGTGDGEIMAAFMQHSGFIVQPGGWCWQTC